MKSNNKKLDAWLSDLSVKIKNSLGDLKGMMPDAEGRKKMLDDLEAKLKAIDENKTFKNILNAEQWTELSTDTVQRIKDANKDDVVSTEELEEIIIDLAVDIALIETTKKGNISSVTAEQIYNMPLDHLDGLTVSEYVKEGVNQILDDMQSESEE